MFNLLDIVALVFSVFILWTPHFGQCTGPQGTFSTTKINRKPLWNSTYTDQLKHDLLLNYDKFARPAQHFNSTVVTIGMTMRHVDLDELKATLTVHSWVKLYWTDEKLKWNATDYGGLTSLHLADHEIWQPDIMLYNSATGSTVNHYGNTHCIAHENGGILWVPPSQFVTFCDLNLRFWPYDTQTCFLRLGSWTYDGNQIDLQMEEGEVDVDLIIENAEWEIEHITKTRNVVKYACCEEPYIDVTYTLALKRKSPSYRAVIITPAFVVIIMTLLNFWLPPQAGEKILLNGCTAIIICIFLLYFTQIFPAMGNNTPLIVLFYSSSLYMVSFAMVCSVAVLWISRTQHSCSLPWMLKQPLTGTIGKWLGLGHYITQSSMNAHRVTAEEMRDQVGVFDEHAGDEHQIIGSTNRAPNQQDWVLLAAALDRICFIFYSLLFAILAIAYSI